MRLKSLIGIILWGGMLVACGPDNRVALAEKLMAERETDSAITVMNEIKEPLHNLSKRDYALYALLMSEAVHRKQQLNGSYRYPAAAGNSQQGEPAKALDYINKSIALRPAKDTARILSLYGVKLELFGKLGQYDSAYHYFQKVISSPEPSSVADAYNNMAKIYHKMGRASDAYPMLQRFIELSDTIRKYRHTEEAIALQELYKHEQLSVENLYWRTRAAERQRNVYWMTTISLLLVWVASAVYFIYRRNRNRLMAQQHQLVQQEKELKQQRKATSESLRRMVEMEQKEARLKETFFRRLSQKVVQELEKGGNVILSDEDWDDIVQNADIIFDNFTKRLQQTYPSLNKDDLRYCCMVKMQLSQSSMAQVMHLERDSVKKRLKRIRMEKMGADSGVTLEELLYNF